MARSAWPAVSDDRERFRGLRLKDDPLLRTHTCDELRRDNVNQSVTVCGWVDSRRDHGNLVFIDLRDRYGKIEVVFDPSQGDELHALARTIRNEDVLKVIGTVVLRSDKDVNPKLPTG